MMGNYTWQVQDMISASLGVLVLKYHSMKTALSDAYKGIGEGGGKSKDKHKDHRIVLKTK